MKAKAWVWFYPDGLMRLPADGSKKAAMREAREAAELDAEVDEGTFIWNMPWRDVMERGYRIRLANLTLRQPPTAPARSS